MAQFYNPRHNAQIRLLKAQIKILQVRVSGSRIITSPAEKSELLRLGAACDHRVDDIMLIVKSTTYRRWLNQLKNGKIFKSVGRPKLTQELRDAAIRMAKENILWGYCRIVGELKKLGFYAGANTVKRILNEAGIYSSPDKGRSKPEIPWNTFIQAHMETVIACDFFTKDVYTIMGKKTAYVLIFIHLGSRRVHCSSATYTPDSVWVTQQARNVMMWSDDLGVKPRFLIRDADTKFSGKFLEVWKSEGVRVIQIPHRAPRVNAFAESFIGTIKKECLNFFLCFSLSQLDYICSSWLRHYHGARPHQGKSIGNNVLDVNFKPVRDGPIKCREDLGGLIKSYYREAA